MSTSIIGIDDRGRRALEQKLSVWWAAALGVPKVGVDDDLFTLGCDPDRGAIVLSQVRHDLDIEIPTSELFEARTVSKLADLIEIRQASMDAHSIIPIRRGGRKQPLFLVHGVGGNLLGFVNLVRSLDADQPVYGIQAQALQNSSPILIQLESMAAYYIRELRLVQPTGPYAFLGLSFGGLIAYEMAQQLVAKGETVNLVGMLDTWQPGYMRQVKPKKAWPFRIKDRLRLVWLNTQKLSLRQTLQYTLGRLKGRALRLMYLRLGSSRGVSLPGSMRRVRDINLMAGARYVVRSYPGRVTLFRAYDRDIAGLPEDLGWRAHAQGGVEIIQLPGDHGQVLAEPTVSHLARELTACLSQPVDQTTPVSAARADFELIEDEVLPAAPTKTEPACVIDLEPASWQSGNILIDHLTAIPEPRTGVRSGISSRAQVREAME
jgi:thioesterase domain-containing protein